MFFKKLFQRKKHNLPKFEIDVWWNYSLHGGRFPMVNFEETGYIPARVGVIVPMRQLDDGRFVYYEVIQVRSQRGGDWIFDSDRNHVDMRFHSIRQETGAFIPESLKKNDDGPNFIHL